MSALPDISIIIPSWNNLEMLRLCIRSVQAHSRTRYQIVVHVNDGSDGTLDWVRRSQIDHTWTPQNVGICKAVNAAFTRCRGEFIVYLNDDMYVLPAWDQLLLERLAKAGDREPCYASGTMIQPSPISPVAVAADYGDCPRRFREHKLLNDHRAKRLACPDWNGATWPPSGVHRRWWNQVGGYSERLPFGFYSDLDFSMKLWQIGCRRFYGLGASLAYHFSESTTSRVVGGGKRNVAQARHEFLRKWGLLPSTFRRFYLKPDQPPVELLPDRPLKGQFRESLRIRLVRLQHGILRGVAAS